jgi:hypothetical protein
MSSLGYWMPKLATYSMPKRMLGEIDLRIGAALLVGRPSGMGKTLEVLNSGIMKMW